MHVGIMVIVLHLGSDGLGACLHYGYYVTLVIGWSGFKVVPVRPSILSLTRELPHSGGSYTDSNGSTLT